MSVPMFGVPASEGSVVPASWPSPARTIAAYGVGAAALGAAIALRVVLDPWLGDEFPFTTLYAAIAFTVWAAGSRPGLAIAIVGYVVSSWLFREPRAAFAWRDAQDAVGLAIYALSALAIVFFGDRLMTARQSANASRREAEAEAAQRRDAEEALRRVDRRKDEFIATVAHELRGPLAVVRQSVHVLSRLNVDGPGRAACGAIERQVQRMSRLLEDLLDLHRIGRGEIELRRGAVAIGDVVASAVEIARPLLEERAHELALELTHDDVVVWGDEVRLSQGIANLLANAARYTPPGGRIVVRCERDGTWASLSVTDNGIGMEPELQARLFALFSRGVSSGDRHREGLGIGLALTRALVEAHGGQVAARSDGLGCGSTFIVRLPLAGHESARPAIVTLPTAGIP